MARVTNTEVLELLCDKRRDVGIIMTSAEMMALLCFWQSLRLSRLELPISQAWLICKVRKAGRGISHFIGFQIYKRQSSDLYYSFLPIGWDQIISAVGDRIGSNATREPQSMSAAHCTQYIVHSAVMNAWRCLLPNKECWTIHAAVASIGCWGWPLCSTSLCSRKYSIAPVLYLTVQ